MVTGGSRRCPALGQGEGSPRWLPEALGWGPVWGAARRWPEPEAPWAPRRRGPAEPFTKRRTGLWDVAVHVPSDPGRDEPCPPTGRTGLSGPRGLTAQGLRFGLDAERERLFSTKTTVGSV